MQCQSPCRQQAPADRDQLLPLRTGAIEPWTGLKWTVLPQQWRRQRTYKVRGLGIN